MFLKEKQSERSPQLLDAARSQLVIVDVQERFGGVVPDLPKVATRAALLAKAAARLGVPVLVSEQYPKGLGKTVAEVAEALPAQALRVEKLSFSAFENADFAEALREGRRNQVVICGVETHVCVLQTVADILENLGAQVCVVKDAVASRKDADRDAALDRMLQLGAQGVTTEMVIFEWLQKAGTPEFKELQALVK